ncbi:uncharacterized protein BX664DRAFT_339762 [Halteromyces radiatus]|uniref:uncharacterized protein n=1 Tax=Halteromyces radiatus TaxID=101107 RepID=UPI00222032AF|nr:uncharacterized protein BX664DRAFT_339762 [Halteromyces radiatus]KAI8083071.1 hypothetical protein BX664DRAFT_339762 [Halteromyces radiatus]
MTIRGKNSLDFEPTYFSKMDSDLSKRSGGGGGWSWFQLISCCFLAILLSTHFHYKLPEPKTHRGVDPNTGLVEFSERNAIETISYLSDTLGYRIVGTVEEAQSADYLKNMILDYKQSSANIPGSPKFDIWIQQETGSHRFDIMDHMVLKAYTNITNIIVRLSCPESDGMSGVRSCEENAILVNSHFDTTLGSPGATDDGSGTAVMLDIIRVLSQRDWTGYKNSIVFLFNGAEETLQDASHAFITMHDLRDTIKSVVNIDACGTTGREILFQANSREMIEAYKQAPYPHGTVLANDVFRTGLILSDTDFRQFVQYGNLTGIDMAIYKNSYLYHTHLDITKHLQPGSIQHLGENTLAIIDHLAKNTSLIGIVPTSEIVFFDIHGMFFLVYSWATAYRIQMATVLMAYTFVGYIIYISNRSTPYRPINVLVLSYIRSTISVWISAIAAILLPITVAVFLTSGFINRHMAWFSHEWYGILIFTPMGLLGAYGVQYLSYSLPGPLHVDMEYGLFNSLVVAFASMTFLTTMTGVASSYVFWVYSVILLLSAMINEFFFKPTKNIKSLVTQPKIHMWTYAIATFLLAFIYSDNVFALIDIFVPLTGRMGVDTPVDIIISIIFGSISFMGCLPSLAHVHRFGKRFLAKILVWIMLAQTAILLSVMVYGGSPGGWAFPYDEMHPKRLFIQHLKNLTSGEAYIAIAEADHGPYINTVLDSLQTELNVTSEKRTGIDGMRDWDSVYPFSHFLGGYRFNTEPYIRKHSNDPKVKQAINLAEQFPGPFPTLTVHNDTYDPATGIRSFSIYSMAPSYTWTVISFDGHVVDWSIQNETPLSKPSHYVVRHVTGFGNDGWKLDLSIKVPETDQALAAVGKWKMRFEFTALEKEGFAGRGEERLIGGVGMLGVIQRILPIWTTTTWLSSAVQEWEL